MTSINLTEDLVVEILSRVPAVSVARLRLTCKKWNFLIKDGRLAKKHSANAPKQSSLVLVLIDFRVYLMTSNSRVKGAPCVNLTCQFSLVDPLSNNSLEEVDIRDVFHCEGLLLCTTKDNRLVVWNPCSGETRWIQPRNSYKESTIFALGYDNKSSCYKILSMEPFGDGTIFQTENEIYDFNSNSWRGIGVTTGWFIPLNSRLGMSVNGITYWLAISQNSAIDESNCLLLSFDFSTERFGSESSLPGDITVPMALSVTRQGRQLCMLDNNFFDGTECNVWMGTKSESTGAMSWSKFVTMSGDTLLFRCQFQTRISFLAEQGKEKKLVISCNRHNQSSKNIIHLMGERKYIELDHHGAKPTDGSPIPVILSCVPSLVQIQQGI